MAGSVCQREPSRISYKSGVASTCLDCSHRPPETETELRIPAADARIGVSCPKHRHQSCRVQSAEPFLHGQIPESAGVLLTGVFRPEETNFGMLGCSNRTVDRPQCLYLVVVVDPLLDVEYVRAFVREKLCRAGHGEWQHLSEPRRQGRPECRRRGLPEAWS